MRWLLSKKVEIVKPKTTSKWIKQASDAKPPVVLLHASSRAHPELRLPEASTCRAQTPF
jgi:transposase-like protein